MTQEEKQLLLKDLCARLPYGVICKSKSYRNILFNSSHISLIESEDIKPYLRPISSMTEEEREEWADLFMKPICELEQYADEQEAQNRAPVLYGKSHSISINWLNAHYMDYHTDDEGKTMIEKGLALVAPEGMYD